MTLRCSVDGCPNKRHCRGLCSTHLARLRKHGDVQPDKPIGWRTKIVHGTYDGYQNHGCRCSACCNANTVYHREANWRKGRHRPRSVVAAERRAIAELRDNHGTETRYRFGCRCDQCRAASARGRRERRQRTAA